MIPIAIDPQFRALIPPATPDERQQLEANLLQDGCRDALVVWNGVLLDGHTRYDICTAHKIPFRVVEQTCADRDAAKLWILQHQLGRRNLNHFQRAELVLQLEPLVSAQAKARMLEGTAQTLGSNEPRVETDLGKTTDTLARLAGISGASIRRAMKVKQSGSPELQAQVRRGEVALSAAAEQCYAGRTGPFEIGPDARPASPQARVPERAHKPPDNPQRKEERTLAGQLAALLAELRRQRKANHDDLKTRRWIPGNIVTRLQTEQLNWIETELEHLVVHLRATAIHAPSPRAKTARPHASPGDNGHGLSTH